jgi:hypothetical protein
MQDFKVVYYPARCLLQGSDPYKESEVLRTYAAEGGEYPSETATNRVNVTRNIYPPTAFSFTVPFAMLPWRMARILWMILTAGGLLFAAILAWSLGATYAPVLSGILIGFLLANSEVLMVLGNPSGVVISLCVVAVWCFLRERCVQAGILCLAISLAVKPQEAGLVWLFFLLAGAVYRKRALQTLLATVAFSLPGMLWVWRVSPHWMQEMHTNILAFAVRGGTTDPNPAAMGASHNGIMINLQTVISVFRDDPRIYNPVSWALCGALLLVWALVTLRYRFSLARAWLAVAAIAPLSLLAVYHRPYDAKLLMLTVPACAMLWAEGGRAGRLALWLTGAGFALTGDVSWTIFSWFVNCLHFAAAGFTAAAIRVFPVPLTLLAMSVFYLWVYARSARATSEDEGASEAAGG